MEREHLFGVIAIVLGLALTSACVADYANSTPQERSATVFDKEHRPGYYSVTCGGGKVKSCHPVYHPPTWTLVYDDEQGRHWAGVGQGVYEIYRAGQSVSVTFLEGAYFGVRYGTTFSPKHSGW